VLSNKRPEDIATELTRFLFGRPAMQDIIWVAVTIAFFVISIGYVHFCDRVK
jgi:hypothetical protein